MLNQAAHVESGGAVCPFCLSPDIEGDSVTTGGGEAVQEMRCPCGAEWTDVYVLARYELPPLLEPDESEPGHTGAAGFYPATLP